jgi:serine/threonine protein kinase
LKLIDHPNIIRLVDVYDEEKYLYIVMELMEGGNLQDYQENNSSNIPEKEV